MSDTIFLTIVVCAFCVLAVFGAIRLGIAMQDRPDYKLIANCIAEYDYQHPRRSQMDNLILALKECR